MEAGFPISIVSKTEQNFGNLWISTVPQSLESFQKSKPWPRSCLQPLHKSMKDGVHLLLPRTTNVTMLNPGGTTHFTAKKQQFSSQILQSIKVKILPTWIIWWRQWAGGYLREHHAAILYGKPKMPTFEAGGILKKWSKSSVISIPSPLCLCRLKTNSSRTKLILLMEEILHHLGCIKAAK